jgi:hypothetical protein
MSKVPEDYLPIAVSTAQMIAQVFHKDQVVILAWDKTANLIHTTTWGWSAKDKEQSAHWGDRLAELSGGILCEKLTWEDFRFDAKRLQELEQMIRELESELAVYRKG